MSAVAGAPTASGDPWQAAGIARTARDRTSVCNAPASNMYFAATGKVAPCWIQLERTTEVWSAGRSLMDIWRGPAFSALRDELRAGRFPVSCGRCAADLGAGCAPLAAAYDRDVQLTDLPTTLELELSNLCNLECRMCTGTLSSRIRRNREHLPPLVSPYDGAFVEQVAEVAPGLEQVRFSGGEPLLHPIVHELAARLAQVRPDLRLDVSTNGTVWGPKVRAFLDRGPVQVNVSFESLRADRYEAIRVGSDFGQLMANLDAFQEHFRTHPGELTINTNPMRPNWDEMPHIVRWCDERGLFLSFNEVIHPDHLSLRSLPADELRAVHDRLAEALSATSSTPEEEPARHNHEVFRNLVARIDRWAREAEERGMERSPGRVTATPVSFTPVPAPRRRTVPAPAPPRSNAAPACRAPSTSLYLDQHGDARPCCQSHLVLGNVADTSIVQIWQGERAQALRAAVAEGDLSLGCQHCRWAVEHSGPESAFARRFDGLEPEPDLAQPVQLEIAPSTTCNLQCTMCSGEFSSAIRSQREGLPALPVRYGADQLEQVAALLPGLTHLELFGGEPLLARESLHLLELVAERAPHVEVRVTTNGTVWNDRVARLAEQVRLSFVVSVDGASAATYEAIRVGARWPVVRARLDELAALTAHRGTNLGIAHCLLVESWWELPDIVRLSSDLQADLWINRVRHPARSSLYHLSRAELAQVIDHLSRQTASLTGLRPQAVDVYHREVEHLRAVLEGTDPQRWEDDDGSALDLVRSAAAPGAPVVTLALTGDAHLAAPLPAAEEAATLGMQVDEGARCASALDVLLPQHRSPSPEIRQHDLDPSTTRVEVRCASGLELVAVLCHDVYGATPTPTRIHVTASRLPGGAS